MTTTISWTGHTGHTWNPLVGCTHVSPGCDHCYAAGVAHRAMQPAHIGLTVKAAGDETPQWNGEVRFLPDRLADPDKWKGDRVFVGSMADIFHADVTDDQLDLIFDTIDRNPKHSFQVLTKRIGRARRYITARYPRGAPNHLWLGTSVESGQYAGRANILAATPGVNRFLSIEPLIGPITASHVADWTAYGCVIVGGESGPHARPMHPDWVSACYEACRRHDVAFHFKQWGEWIPETAEFRRLNLPLSTSVWFGDNGTIYDTVEERDAAIADRVVIREMFRAGRTALKKATLPSGVTAEAAWLGRRFDGARIMDPATV